MNRGCPDGKTSVIEHFGPSKGGAVSCVQRRRARDVDAWGTLCSMRRRWSNSEFRLSHMRWWRHDRSRQPYCLPSVPRDGQDSFRPTRLITRRNARSGNKALVILIAGLHERPRMSLFTETRGTGGEPVALGDLVAFADSLSWLWLAGSLDLCELALEKRLHSVLFASDHDRYEHREATDVNNLTSLAWLCFNPVVTLQFHVVPRSALEPAVR